MQTRISERIARLGVDFESHHAHSRPLETGCHEGCGVGFGPAPAAINPSDLHELAPTIAAALADLDSDRN